MELSQSIKEKAKELGFSACGIAEAEKLPAEREHLKHWLEAGMHADMKWMEPHLPLCADPGMLVKDARSVVVVLLNYFPSRVQQDLHAPVVSKYAYGEDYHYVMKNRLKQLGRFLKELVSRAVIRMFTDSAPVLEKKWAVRAGLGWTGKHSLLITRNRGSFFFIGELITNVKMRYDRPFEQNLCGTCTRCIESCPTHAIVSPGVLDARKCISYNTVEHKGPLPDAIRPVISNRIFGCDICQDVCPWNRFSVGHQIPEFIPAPGMLEMTDAKWNKLDEKTYNALFHKTPVDRIGYEGLKRNLAFLKGFGR